jgi:iron complex transport system permease protein
MKFLQISSTRNRNTYLLLSLGALLIASAIISICVGSVPVSLEEIAKVLFGYDADSTVQAIILYSRLPRTCAAALAGAALAVSGAVIQILLHNPLASPGVIGVNSSAGLAVALVCALFPTAQVYTPLIAMAGALLGTALVAVLSQISGASRTTVILSGIAISNLFSACIDAVVTLVPEALNGVSDFRIGGFMGVTLEKLLLPAAIIAAGLLILLSVSRQLDILALGSDIAASLGLPAGLFRGLTLIPAAALAGAAVSFSGLIGFAGLIVPHIIRKLIGEESFPLLLGCILGGSSFMLLCDTLSRIIFAPFEIPVGITLAFLGCPFFLWILFSRKGGRK